MASKAASVHASAGATAKSADSEAAPAMNPAKVRQFIDRLRQPDRLGKDFFSDADVGEWDQWASTTPASLDAVEESDWPLPIKMPRKCVQPAPGRATCGGRSGTEANRDHRLQQRWGATVHL